MSSSDHIIFQPQQAEVETQQLGPYQLTTLIPESDEIHMTAYRVKVKPRSTTSIGYHVEAEEIYYVIAGNGTAILNGEVHALQAGDFLRLPPKTKHGFVTGDQALVMLDIHSPGSRPDRDIFFTDDTPDGFSARS
ncbi:MAG: cupin domain-containing protein [Verrucomicrobiota bacterium]